MLTYYDILTNNMTNILLVIVEMTNKAEIRPEEQNEKTESCKENLWNEIHLKGP